MDSLIQAAEALGKIVSKELQRRKEEREREGKLLSKFLASAHFS
jgi:hypothetical protein